MPFHLLIVVIRCDKDIVYVGVVYSSLHSDHAANIVVSSLSTAKSLSTMCKNIITLSSKLGTNHKMMNTKATSTSRSSFSCFSIRQHYSSLSFKRTSWPCKLAASKATPNTSVTL